MADTGNGATITFGTSGWSGNCTLIGGTEETREALDVSHLGTSDYMEFDPTDLVDGGQFDVEFLWDQSASQPPITAAAESITVTFPLKSGESTPATLAGTGFLTRRRGADARNGEIMSGSYTVKWDGKTGPTYTGGS